MNTRNNDEDDTNDESTHKGRFLASLAPTHLAGWLAGKLDPCSRPKGARKQAQQASKVVDRREDGEER